jgi:hypothetical protein
MTWLELYEFNVHDMFEKIPISTNTNDYCNAIMLNACIVADYHTKSKL